MRHAEERVDNNGDKNIWEVKMTDIPISEIDIVDMSYVNIPGWPNKVTLVVEATADMGARFVGGTWDWYTTYDGSPRHAHFDLVPDYPNFEIELELKFYGEVGDLYYWNDEWEKYYPEGFDPNDYLQSSSSHNPEDSNNPNGDKAKILDKMKARDNQHMSKKEKGHHRQD